MSFVSARCIVKDHCGTYEVGSFHIQFGASVETDRIGNGLLQVSFGTSPLAAVAIRSVNGIFRVASNIVLPISWMKKMPPPARITVLSFRLYAIPSRGPRSL